MVYNINNENFKNFYMNNIPKGINRNGIKSIRFNKKSILVIIDKDLSNFFFNDFFNKKVLFNELIFYLSKFIIENNLICFNTVGVVSDIDYLKYVFKNGLNVSYR